MIIILLTETIKIKKTGMTIQQQKHYIDKGYIIDKEFEVKVHDLSLGSSHKVLVQCDNIKCKQTKIISYADYIRCTKNESYDYYCKKCSNIKMLQYKQEKFIKGELTLKDKGYWTFKENIINAVNNFIKQNNRFPLRKEFGKNNLPDITTILRKFPSFVSFKSNFITNFLTDNNNDACNRSEFEVIFANYLISQGLGDFYKRNQKPFPKNERKFQSDFSFYFEDGIEIHIEIWGYPKTNIDKRATSYNKERKIKELLYEKYKHKIILISIEYEDFQGNYKNIVNKLHTKLSKYLNYDFKIVENNKIRPKNLLSEIKIYEILLEYGNNKIPKVKELQSTTDGASLYYLIYKKYGGLLHFANMHNMYIKNNINHINNSNIMEIFMYMIKTYNGFLKQKDLIKYNKLDKKISGLLSYINHNGGYLYCKIKYCEYCLINNINFLNNINIREFLLNNKNVNIYRSQDKNDNINNMVNHLLTL